MIQTSNEIMFFLKKTPSFRLYMKNPYQTVSTV